MRKFLAVLAFLACGPTWADGGSIPNDGTEPGEVEMIQVQGVGAIDYQRLFEEVSEPGETMDAFVLRIAPQLAEYTAASGFEACGAIATDGERFGVIVGSNGGHTVCVNFHRRVPDGMTSTRQTVHSHTTMKTYRLTATDLLVVGGRPVGSVQRGGNPERFSDEDYAAPGYVVTGKAVKHQAGKGTERVIGTLR
ncbi:hypothetical protein EM864_14640 [Stenotrophomonas acidaminiphila]|uniref:hypothetical protein n=1 Tax=Stenotrophomonas acidaminiphila TaxID=128780 RepID=UPI00240773BC|nr:hypothetical protein [Stenotrophomonas acidaminiphila]MDF9442977.1 hypothetical protein [Stenotrophomonas acidaminiphila]